MDRPAEELNDNQGLLTPPLHFDQVNPFALETRAEPITVPQVDLIIEQQVVDLLGDLHAETQAEPSTDQPSDLNLLTTPILANISDLCPELPEFDTAEFESFLKGLNELEEL